MRKLPTPQELLARRRQQRTNRINAAASTVADATAAEWDGHADTVSVDISAARLGRGSEYNELCSGLRECGWRVVDREVTADTVCWVAVQSLPAAVSEIEC